jgi:thiol-disulfide isomerase/thioredoxin
MSNTKRRELARVQNARRQNLIFGLVVVAVAGAIIFSATAGSKSTPVATELAAAANLETCPTANASSEPVENGLPDHTLDCLGEDKTVNLAGLRGPLVINVWGSWCPPCVEELPWLAEFHQAAAGQISVIGINVSDNTNAALQMLIDTDVKFASLYDPNSESRATIPWSGTPVTLFVDSAGVVIYRHEGRLPDANSIYDMANLLFKTNVINPRA